MPVYKKEDNGTWYVLTRYVDWKGERKQRLKRGFAPKKERRLGSEYLCISDPSWTI